MIAGRSPFPGDYEQAVVYEILNQDPEPLTALRTGVPMGLEWIVNKCLAKEKGARYQTTKDLIVDLNGVDAETLQTSSQRLPAVRVAPTKIPSWLRYSSAILGGILLTILANYLFGDRVDASDNHTVTTVTHLTVDGDRQYHPDLHPDGRSVVYSSGATYSVQKLLTRSISGSSASRITRSFDASENQPSISPDGNLVSFLSGGNLYSVDYPAGVPAPLILNNTRSGNISSSDWSPDGTKIAFTTTRDSVFVFDLITREQLFLAALREPHSIDWSPVGDRLAIVSENENGSGLNVAPSQIFTIRLLDGSINPVSSVAYQDASPVWHSDGRSIYYVSNRGGGHDIFRQRISVSDSPIGEPLRITTGLSLRSIDLADDGTHIVGSEISYSQNIWVSDISSGAVVSAEDAEALTTGNQVIEGVFVSRDGDRLAYDSDARGDQNIFVMPVEGGEALQITYHPSPEFVYSWSPDDQEIAFHAFRNGSRDVYTVSLEDLSLTPVATDSNHERYPSWSSDKSIIGITVTLGSTSQKLVSYKKSADGTWAENDSIEDVKIGFAGAKFSPVEEKLVYDSEGSLWLYDQKTDVTTLLVDKSFSPGDLLRATKSSWAPDGQTLFFKVTDGDGVGAIWSVPISGESPRQVLTLGSRAWGFDHMSAGKNQLFYTLKDIESDLWLLEMNDRDEQNSYK
jgi:Tol biopolymer transport system component